jgi:hypothetical protein
VQRDTLSTAAGSRGGASRSVDGEYSEEVPNRASSRTVREVFNLDSARGGAERKRPTLDELTHDLIQLCTQPSDEQQSAPTMSTLDCGPSRCVPNASRGAAAWAGMHAGRDQMD